MHNRLLVPTVFFSLVACVIACSSCKKPKAVDDAGVDAAPSAVASASAAPSASEAASAAPSASADQPVTGGAVAAGAAGGPFQGVYKCMNDLTLTQNGNHVTGITALKYNAHLSHEVTRISCTVNGDKCVGTSTSVSEKDGKVLTKNPKSIGMTLTRRPNGDMGYLEANNTGFPCAKAK